MFSTRPIAPLPRRRTLDVFAPVAHLMRRIDGLPHSPTHPTATARALYAVGAAQVATAAVYIGLVASAFTGAFIPVTSDVLFAVPALVALLGLAMVVISLLGSISAPWMAAVLSLPLALTALYVDGTFASVVLVALQLVPAGWLCARLLTDSERRARARAFD
ncbi:hypothetical protein EK0264_08115 [Epidermidibacterium keratini]|uniref:Uncharacterized protein n=1 Tax=Epidermidibacterium keratini TaxID=1891644 RepID=A0A7L4YLT8_9ACTN|nr:hypothetical protein [Epidermidibacterium keratini]QHC00245.1 hypothetical protein EK0264_08115 [Epidermidibacterium keratini]